MMCVCVSCHISGLKYQNERSSIDDVTSFGGGGQIFYDDSIQTFMGLKRIHNFVTSFKDNHQQVNL